MITSFKSLSGITKLLSLTPLFNFGKKKKKYDRGQAPSKQDQLESEDEAQGDYGITSTDVKIDDKYMHKTKSLHQKYMASREKPLVCLDDYLLEYEFIIERKPIFVPHHPLDFQAEKNRYQVAKKTKFYLEIPKDLRLEEPDNIFGEAAGQAEDFPSHKKVISPTQSVTYRENSRNWKNTDPSINDPRSIQNYSSHSVFFIVKRAGVWRFPSKLITQRDSHKLVFQRYMDKLFSGCPNSDIFFGDRKPMNASKQERDDLDRGKGIRTLTFKGVTVMSIPKNPNTEYEDYAWVPKPLLADYFDDEYFSKAAVSTYHAF